LSVLGNYTKQLYHLSFWTISLRFYVMKWSKILYSLVFVLLVSKCGSQRSGEIAVKKAQNHTFVIILTDFGAVEIELYDEKAQVTVANFLAYVDAGLYENGRFYRVVNHDNDPNQPVVKINVIQGGIASEKQDKRFPPIEHETTEKTGILHTDGVISMARSAPGSASSEFFICINDQPSLDFGGDRNPDKQGFSAFGKVVNGMDVVRTIYSQPYEAQRFTPPVAIHNIVQKR